MFSYILLFLSSILFTSPKLESKTKKYFYSIIFTSSVFAYTLLGQFSLILISLGYSRFPILFLSFILFLLTILIDKKIKHKFIYLKESFKSEIIILRNNFRTLFKRHPEILTFGEDTGKIGGVNQAMEGMQEEFGEIRVFDTGIREASIIGQGIGLALRGLRPIAEIQY